MTKSKKLILFPTTLSILFSLTLFLLSMADRGLMNRCLSSYEQLPFIKISLTYLWIVPVVGLYFLSRRSNFEKIFKTVIVFAIASLVCSLFFFIIKNAGSSSDSIVGLRYGFASLFYCKAYVFFYFVHSMIKMVLIPILLWGLINEIFSLKAAFKIYFPLTALLGLASSLLPSSLGFISKSLVQYPLAMIVASITLLGAVLVIFNQSFSSFENSVEDIPTTPGYFPFFGAAFLLSGTLIAHRAANFLFKGQLKSAFPDSASYIKYLAKFSVWQGSISLILTALFAYGGYKFSKRYGFKKMLFASLGLVTLGASLYLSCIHLNLNIKSQLYPQAISHSLIVNVTSYLLMPLVQLLYLHFPKAVRFRRKILTEMLLVPIFSSVGNFLIQIPILLFGSVQKAQPFYLGIYCVPIMLLFLAARSSTKKYDLQMMALENKA